jgi:hypothetical protein
VTLSKELPFTFVDHALKCGDSLVGVSRQEIEAALKGASRQRDLWEGKLEDWRQQEQQRFALFHADSRNDADDQRKREALRQQQASTAFLRSSGDLLVAAFFNSSKPKDRQELRDLYLAATITAPDAAGLEEELAEPLERLREGEKGITPLHWELEFPDVFDRPQGGFDGFVGNPPFVGGRKMKEALGEGFQNWLQDQFPESSANADLSAFFFLRCYQLLRSGGSLGLIATNTIAQGDTRSTGLRWICLHGGTIYSARKRYKWPGVAAVVVSVVHLFKGAYSGVKLLDRQPVEQITAFLFANGGHEDPRPLSANAGKSFVGSYVLGMGFTFDDSGPADDDTPCLPSPIATMEQLIAENPKNSEVIFPYIGGEEVNSSPTHAHHRFVIDFRDRSEEECRREWPELMEVVERKVKPERQRKKLNGEFVLRSPLPQRWWHHADKRPALYAAIAGCERVLAISRVTNYLLFSLLPSGSVFAESTVIFPLDEFSHLAAIQSRAHEQWALFLSSSLEERLRYGPTDCFETFPFPAALLESTASDPALTAHHQSLETIGERYHQFRGELMVANKEGLTTTYNRFNDPAETDPQIAELRRLHSELDQTVLNAYGWSDLPTTCGFGLDYLDTDDEVALPEGLQERIDSGDLFFDAAPEAVSFDSQLRAATGSKRKLPWRHRWPDGVRDEVLARLLALNAERYAEEVAPGGHGGGRSRASANGAGGPGGSGKRRARPPKATQAADTGQIGLEL